VLKNGRYFLVLDQNGMISYDGAAGFGLYGDDTRYLSAYEIKLLGRDPVLLYANTDDGYAGRFIYGNQATGDLSEQRILLQRDVVIDDGVFEKLHIVNYDVSEANVPIAIKVNSDFVDMFEVRGQTRSKRGVAAQPDAGINRVIYNYRGLDGSQLGTKIAMDAGAAVPEGPNGVCEIQIPLKLAARAAADVEIAIVPSIVPPSSKPPVVLQPPVVPQGTVSPVVAQKPVAEDPSTILQNSTKIGDYGTHLKAAETSYLKWRQAAASIESDDPVFNKLVERSYRDLFMLRQPTPRGWCIAAGLPWFAAAFGRDEDIVSLETLPFIPQLSRDVLKVLSAYQGTRTDPKTEEQPGKIMHELRLGEMTRLGEVPFGPYYGTVDATPLYLVLLGRYIDWTGDQTLLKQLWPTANRAAQFLQSESKSSGFLPYGGSEATFLSNQGWKDSGDSIMHADGTLASSPVAVCEAQGYMYSAWLSVVKLARLLGDRTHGDTYLELAGSLKTKFSKDFWMPAKGFVAEAVDRGGRQCDVVSSNPGHLLGSGILSKQQEEQVARRLSAPDMFSGWGIRTLSSNERRYNPMSYHDGSVWPHDNAVIVEGLCRADRREPAVRIFEALLDVARTQPDLRLPELFCGFSKTSFKDPVAYPVSCVPQAWAAGSVLGMLSACLGLEADAAKGELRIKHSVLPEGVNRLAIRNLAVGRASADLLFVATPTGVRCRVSRLVGPLKVLLQ
jgi:glycogen debranching enzyme